MCERGQFHFEAVMQRKQANVEANGGQEKNEEKEIMLITIMSVCGVTATASVRRSVWMPSLIPEWWDCDVNHVLSKISG